MQQIISWSIKLHTFLRWKFAMPFMKKGLLHHTSRVYINEQILKQKDYVVGDKTSRRDKIFCLAWEKFSECVGTNTSWPKYQILKRGDTLSWGINFVPK
jgi:hypothetical protein